MKDQKITIIRFLYLGFLSWFGTGFFPKAPGTIGSFATLPLIYLLSFYQVSFMNIAIGTTLLFIVSCFVADYAQNREEVHDPGWIVMDEVIGMLITWLFVFPSTEPIDLALVFILFRFFDIVKIWPANWCDKNIKNGMGTIIDDVVSAFYAGFVILVINHFRHIAQ